MGDVPKNYVWKHVLVRDPYAIIRVIFSIQIFVYYEILIHRHLIFFFVHF